MPESGRPLSISHTVTNADDEVKVCDICGDAGFDDLLAICSQCNEGAEHVYCMQTLLDMVPSNWVCEECKLKGSQESRKNRLASVDRQEHISIQTCLDETDNIDLPGPALKAFSDKVETVKDCAVSFPSKKISDGSAVEHHISTKEVYESAGNLTTDCSMSLKSSANLSDAGKLKELPLSRVELKGYSTLLALTGTQSLNATQSGRTCMHLSGTNALKQTSLLPVTNLKGSHNSVEIELSNNDISPMTKVAPSPRRVLSKSSSAKFSDDPLSFLLPSRPKELIRSSSGTARVPSVGARFKTSKMSNQSSNARYVTGKVSGQHFNISDPKSTEASKLKSFDNTDFIKSKSFGSLPVTPTCTNFQQQIGSLPNVSTFRDFQEGPEDITRGAGLGNWKNSVALKVSNASGCTEWKSVSPVRTWCFKCREMGHSAEMCTGANPKEYSETTAGGLQSVFKNKISVCFGDGRSVGNRPLAPVQANKLVHGSKGDLLGGGKEPNPGKEEFLRSGSNLEGHRKDLYKTVNANNSKQLPKPTYLSGNNVKHSPPAYPVPLTPLSQNGTYSPHVGNSTPRQFRPANSFLSVQARQPLRPHSHPGIVSSLQTVQGIRTPVQPSWNVDLTTALCLHHDYFSPEVQAIPDAEILWQGSLKVASSTGNITHYSGMQAHASNRADPKVFKAAKELPAELQVEELERGVQNDSWPRSFQGCPPTSNSVGIFFFPEDMESHDTFYKPLLDRMIVYDLTLRVKLEFAQLLIFPSHLLPATEQRWDDMTYLWGVFRANKGNALLTTRKDLPLAVMTPSVPPLDRDAGNQSQSPSSVGEVIDMDIDMEGGWDISAGHKIEDRDHSEPNTYNRHVDSPLPLLPPGAPFPPLPSGTPFPLLPPGAPFPPLPPGTPPTQPSPPPTPSHSQQGDSPELFSDVSKHGLPVDHNIRADNAADQSRYSHKEHTSALDHSSSSPQLHQDGISISSNLLGHISEHDVIHSSECFSEAAVQTAGKVLFGVNLKGHSQKTKLTSINSGDLVCSTPLEFQQNGEGASATSIERGFCQQLESRSCLSSGGAHIFHVEDVNSDERAQVDGRKNREMVHLNQREKEANGGMDFDRSKKCFSTKVRGKRKTEVEGHDEFKENRKHFGRKVQKQCSIGAQRQPHCSEESMHLLSARISHSGASSCSLSGSPPFSPTRSEITGNAMLMKETNLVSKCHRWLSSPSSSESLATESGQILSRSGKSIDDLSHDDEACFVQEMSEKIRNTVLLRRTATCSSVLGEENTSKGFQCNPGFWESIEMAPQGIGSRMCGHVLPCLRLFPMEESSTEYDTAEVSNDCEVDQAGGESEQRRGLVTQSMPLVEQLERRPINSSTVDMETDSPRKGALVQAGKGLLISDPQLTLSFPHYRKQGNTWSRIEDDSVSFCGRNVNLSLSLS